MRWDSDEPPTAALHQAHASESGTAILRVSPNIAETDDDDSLNSTERDMASSKGADAEIARPAKAIAGGIVVRTDFAVERSASVSSNHGTRFSYGSTPDSTRKS